MLLIHATYTDLFTTSNLHSTILNPGSALSAAEDFKRKKYSQLVADFEFIPVAVERSGIIRSAGCSILTDIRCHILMATNDIRKMSYIFQQISVAIIRGNALAMTAHHEDMPRSWLRDTDIQNGDTSLRWIKVYNYIVAFSFYFLQIHQSSLLIALLRVFCKSVSFSHFYSYFLPQWLAILFGYIRFCIMDNLHLPVIYRIFIGMHIFTYIIHCYMCSNIA